NDAANFDKVAVHFSSDEGRTWTAATVIRLQGLPAGMRFPFDPTLVTLPDGRLRLYFTSRRFEESHPAIHSAISSDGIDYIYEPGVRFAIADRPVIDCAVVLHQNTFHLFSPDNGTEIHHGQGNATSDNVGYHAVSTDGLTFTRVADVHIEGRGRRWLGNAHSDGRLITFCGTGMPLAQPNQKPDGNVWMATSTDAQTWRIIPSPSIYGGDPGAIPNPDGTLTIVITGEPRNREPRNR
ncbi:MAG TPA: exo-alpha-sialidase, partial [Prosthecobacter sp.]|nr:exo-alpha-sialidase [Prosthecobacter sp.]